MGPHELTTRLERSHLVEKGYPTAARLVGMHVNQNGHKVQWYPVSQGAPFHEQHLKEHGPDKPAVRFDAVPFGYGYINLLTYHGDRVHSYTAHMKADEAYRMLRQMHSEGVPWSDRAARTALMEVRPNLNHNNPGHGDAWRQVTPEDETPVEAPEWRPGEVLPEDFYQMGRGSRSVKYALPPWGRARSTRGITHAELDRWLGKKNRRVVASGRRMDDPRGPTRVTKLVYRDGPDIVARLHDTDVVRLHPDGTFTLRTGGWHTPTTGRMIRAITGGRVWSEKGRLHIEGKPIGEGMRWPELPPAPEVDYRPQEMLPEDYYLLSRRRRGTMTPVRLSRALKVRLSRAAARRRLSRPTPVTEKDFHAGLMSTKPGDTLPGGFDSDRLARGGFVVRYAKCPRCGGTSRRTGSKFYKWRCKTCGISHGRTEEALAGKLPWVWGGKLLRRYFSGGVPGAVGCPVSPASVYGVPRVKIGCLDPGTQCGRARQERSVMILIRPIKKERSHDPDHRRHRRHYDYGPDRPHHFSMGTVSPVRYARPSGYNHLFVEAAQRFHDALPPERQAAHRDDLARFQNLDHFGIISRSVGGDADKAHDIATHMLFGGVKGRDFFSGHDPSKSALGTRFLTHVRWHAHRLSRPERGPVPFGSMGVAGEAYEPEGRKVTQELALPARGGPIQSERDAAMVSMRQAGKKAAEIAAALGMTKAQVDHRMRAIGAARPKGKPLEAGVVDRMRQMKSEGKSLSQIAAELGTTRDAVWNALRRRQKMSRLGTMSPLKYGPRQAEYRPGMKPPLPVARRVLGDPLLGGEPSPAGRGPALPVAPAVNEAHLVTFRTRRGKTGQKIVVTSGGHHDARRQVREAGHIPLTVRPATVADFRRVGSPQERWPVEYAAWRAPAGGMIVRGTYYVGGKMVPDLQGKFANPPKRRRLRGKAKWSTSATMGSPQVSKR